MGGKLSFRLWLLGSQKNLIKQLPFTYKANRSAWMTMELFEEVQRWDAELKGRKMLLPRSSCY